MTEHVAASSEAEHIDASATATEVAQRARHRIARRLLPFLTVLYVIAFLDRMNIGAAALQMPHDLGFSPTVIGFGAGIFFFGYFMLGFPGALIAERWSARKLMGCIMIGWGLVTVFMAFIHTALQFYVVRFLVGATESGFFPGAIVYMSHWFRYEDRAKAVAAFYAANPLSYVIGSPLAGVLLGLSWLGLRGWRWLFILEGIPAVLFGIITLFYLTDWPREAKWLPPDEQDWITEQLHREKEAKKRVRAYSIWEAIRHRDVVLLTLCYFCAMTGSYGIGFWFPTIVKRLSGLSDLKVTLIGALPYVATAQWMAFRSHARASLACGDARVALRLWACPRSISRVQPATLDHSPHYCGWCVLWFSAGFLGGANAFPRRICCRRFHRANQFCGQPRWFRGAHGDGIHGQSHS